jgi:hypothetical protein
MPRPMGENESCVPGTVWSCVFCEDGLVVGKKILYCQICMGYGFTGDPIGPFGHTLDLLPEGAP